MVYTYFAIVSKNCIEESDNVDCQIELLQAMPRQKINK